MPQEFSFDRKELLQTLKIAKGALASNRAVVPVFAMYAILDDRVIAYNDVIGVVVHFEEPCGLKAVLPGDTLLKLLSGYSGTKVKLTESSSDDGQKFKMQCARSKATLEAMNVEAWPWHGPPEQGDMQMSVALNDVVIAGLKSVMVSMSHIDAVPSYTGVTVEKVGNDLALFSTNRRSISRFEIKNPIMVSSDGKPLTLPPVFCEQLLALWGMVEDLQTHAMLKVYDDHVVAELGEDVILFSRLLYVEDHQLTNKTFQSLTGGATLEFEAVPDEFRRVVDRFASVSCERMSMKIDSSGMRIESQGFQGGELQDRAPWKRGKSANIEIDVPAVKTALGETSVVDFREGTDDRFVVFSNGKEFVHCVACARS